MRTDLMNLRRATAVAAFCLLVVALLATADRPEALAQTPAPESGTIVKIPLVAGDTLPVRFTEPFEAGDLAKGLTPQAEVAEDKVISGVVMVAAGTPVTFAVVPDAVEDNGRAGKPGKFELVFESVEAVDGQTVPLTGTLARKGSGRGIIVKIFTLFLIKGEDPGVDPEEVFPAEIAENTYIYAEQP